MAENTNYIGVAMGLDVTDLKAGLSEANKQIQLANSKFKAASSGMEDWTKSTEGLNAKIEQLDTILKAQRSKLSGLQAEYKKVAKEQGENSDAARRLKVQINNQQAAVNKTERELKNYTETLKDAKAGNIDLEKVSLKAGKAVKKTGENAEEAGEGFTIAKGAIAEFIGNGLSKLASAAVDAAKSMLGLADSTREYRRTLATLDAAAGDVGVSTDYIRDKFTDLMGVFNDEGSVTEGLNNLLTAGFDENSLDGITAALEGASLKWKDTLKFEGLADSLQEWIGSGGESLTGNFAELLERMGYNLEDVKAKTEGMTDAQRRNYAVNLLNKEGLANVSKEYREQNTDMVEAQKANVEYQNSMAELGEVAEPIMTELRKGMTDLLKAITDIVAGGDLEALKTSINDAFEVLINDVLPKVVNGLKWIADNKEVVAAMVGVIIGFAGALKLVNIVLAAQSAIAMANPTTWMIMAIVAAVGVLYVAIVALIANWDKVKAAGAAAWEWIKNAWSAAGEWFAGIGRAIGDAFSKAWNGLVNGAKKAWDGTKAVFSKVASFFGDIFSKAWQKVKDIFSTGGKIFTGIVDGISNAFKKIVNAIIRGINKVVAIPFNAINKTLDKIRNVSIAGVTPFSGLISEISVPEIPELAKGGVLKKGQIGLLEGDGAEAVVPLEKNLGWIKKLAAELSRSLDVSGVKGSAAALAYGGAGVGAGAMQGGNRSTVVDARMTVNYNGSLSRKELKRLEVDNYNAVRTRLKAEGAI